MCHGERTKAKRVVLVAEPSRRDNLARRTRQLPRAMRPLSRRTWILPEAPRPLDQTIHANSASHCLFPPREEERKRRTELGADLERGRERKRVRSCAARNSAQPRKDALRSKEEFRASFTRKPVDREGTAGGCGRAVSAIFVRNSRLSAVSRVLG